MQALRKLLTGKNKKANVNVNLIIFEVEYALSPTNYEYMRKLYENKGGNEEIVYNSLKKYYEPFKKLLEEIDIKKVSESTARSVLRFKADLDRKIKHVIVQEKEGKSSIVKDPNISGMIEQVEKRLDDTYLADLKTRMKKYDLGDIYYANKVMLEIIPDSYEKLDTLLEHQILKEADEIKIRDIYEKIKKVENDIIKIAKTVSEEEQKRCSEIIKQYRKVYPELRQISTAKVNSERRYLMEDNKNLVAVEKQLKSDFQHKIHNINQVIVGEQLAEFKRRIDLRADKKIERFDNAIKKLTENNSIMELLNTELKELLDKGKNITQEETTRRTIELRDKYAKAMGILRTKDLTTDQRDILKNDLQKIKTQIQPFLKKLEQSQEIETKEEPIYATVNATGDRLGNIFRQIKQVGYKDKLINQVERKELTKAQALKEIKDLSNEVSEFLVQDEIDDDLVKEILNVKNKVEEFRKNLNAGLQLIENKEQFSKVPANVRSSVITSLNLLEQKLDKHALLKKFKKDKHPENRIVEINDHINKVSEILENNNNNYVNETLSLLKTRLEEYKKDIENTLQRAESESLINNLSDESTKKHLTYISKLIDNKGYKQIIIDKAEKGELRRAEIVKHIKSKIDAFTEFSNTCTTDQPVEVLKVVTSLKNRLDILYKDIFKELEILDKERISQEFSDKRGNLSESDKEAFTIELRDEIKKIEQSLNPSDISKQVYNTVTTMQISEEDAKRHVLTNFIYPEFHDIEELYYRHNVLFKPNEQELIEKSFARIEQSIDKLNQEIKANKNHLINEPIYGNIKELQEENMLSATADYNFLRRNNNVQLYNDTISQSAIIQHNIKPELPKRDPEVTQATNKQLGYQEIKYNDSSIQAGDNGLDYGSDDYATVKKPKNRGNLSQNNEHVDPIYDTLSSIAGTTADIGNSSKDNIYAVPSSVVRKSENRGNSSKDPIYDEPKSAIKKPADIGNSSEDPIYDEPKSTIKKPVDIGNSSQNPHSATDPTTTSQEIKILSNMFDRLNIMLSIKNEQEKNNVDSSNLDPTTTSKEIQHKKKTPPPVPPNKPTGAKKKTPPPVPPNKPTGAKKQNSSSPDTGAKKKTPPPVPPNKPTGAKVNTPLIPKPYKGILTETANLQDALACLDANRSNKDNKVYPNGDNKVNRDDNKVKRDNNKGDNMSLEQHDLNPNKKKRKEEETKRQEKNNKEKSNLVML